jgi:guanylate kinase
VYGQHKGIPKSQVRQALASGKDVLMRIDVQGAATVHDLLPDAVLIFLVAGSEQELLQRLHRRGTESAEDLEERTRKLRQEMDCIPWFDYVVVNSDGELDAAVQDIAAIVRAEKCRTIQRAVRL